MQQRQISAYDYEVLPGLDGLVAPDQLPGCACVADARPEKSDVR